MPADLKIKKTQLRSKMLRIRESLSINERSEKDLMISQHIIKWLETQRTIRKVFLYYPVRSEIDLRSLRKLCSLPLAIPKITSNERKEMNFVLWDESVELAKNSMGIFEPQSSETLEADSTTLLLTPCLGVGLNGERLGYGGGYYDRYFAANNSALKVGVCYSASVLDSLPQGPNDIRLDGYVTEEMFALKSSI